LCGHQRCCQDSRSVKGEYGMTHEPADRRALLLLAAGSVVGISLGILAAFHGSRLRSTLLPADAIALVNGKPISEEEYTRAVVLLESDKRTGVTEADRAFVLQRLIEEELLIQQGIKTGVVDSDRAVRKAITQAMLASVVAESASIQPSTDELRAFYTVNPSLFVHPAPVGTLQTGGTTEAGEPPRFEDVRDQVETVYTQRARDQALHEYLEWLRSEAKISLMLEEPQ